MSRNRNDPTAAKTRQKAQALRCKQWRRWQRKQTLDNRCQLFHGAFPKQKQRKYKARKNTVNGWISWHNNDLKHTAGITKQAFGWNCPRSHSGLSLKQPWPESYGGYLSYLDAEVKKKRIHSIDGFQRAWSEVLPWSYIHKSTASMPSRLQEVSALRGERTQYGRYLWFYPAKAYYQKV